MPPPRGPRCARHGSPSSTTPLGRVRGVARGRRARFLGIPYAAPPRRRAALRAAGAAAAWSGVARGAAPSAPLRCQPADGLSQRLGLLGDHAQSEDCLTLNVFAPAAPARTLRPVLVWLHGGAFQTGTAAGPAYDGARARAARRRRGGDAQLPRRRARLPRTPVRPAARTSASRISSRRCASCGTRSRLRRRPARASPCSASRPARARSSCLLAMPAARGLFRARDRAERRAGGTAERGRGGRARAILVREARRYESRDLDWLRSLSAEQILAAQAACAEPGPRRIGMFFAPVVDGELLPEPPLAAVAAGEAREVELIVGTTADEMRLFTLVPGFGEIPEAALPHLVATRLPGRARDRARARGAAPRALPRGEDAASSASSRSRRTRACSCPRRASPRRRRAISRDTFMYRFSWRSPLAEGVARRLPRARRAVRARHLRPAGRTRVRRRRPRGRARRAPP